MLYSLLLIITSMIWGGGFVAQSAGGDALGPWTFNGMRYVISGPVLLALIPLLTRFGLTKKPETPAQRRQLIKAGICCGVALFVASNLQQLGITLGDSTGKAGFLTACYIVLVPIIGIALGRKCGWNVWVGAAVALVGLFLLCIKGSFSLTLSDSLLLLCALAYSWQILTIDHFSAVDSVRMACVEFLTVGVLSIPLMLFTEILPDPAAWVASFGRDGALLSLAYAALLSGCLAYTLQVVAQSRLHPAVASLLMSLEAVFSVLAGWIILGEQLSPRELAGCGLIFAAVVVAQLPIGKKQNA